MHDIEGISPGLYKNTHLIKAGNFREKTGYLYINQAIARDCAVTTGLFHSSLARLRMNSESNSKSRLKTTKEKFIVRFNGLNLLALNFSSGRIMFRTK
ncbi:hypothetical protein [Anabaena sp. WA102]|uniref:hypothetical protein n=1 Tax=Anabaena sp. WA102 TaxID=1647413 RepID=UPI002FF746AF